MFRRAAELAREDPSPNPPSCFLDFYDSSRERKQIFVKPSHNNPPNNTQLTRSSTWDLHEVQGILDKTRPGVSRMKWGGRYYRTFSSLKLNTIHRSTDDVTGRQISAIFFNEFVVFFLDTDLISAYFTKTGVLSAWLKPLLPDHGGGWRRSTRSCRCTSTRTIPRAPWRKCRGAAPSLPCVAPRFFSFLGIHSIIAIINSRWNFIDIVLFEFRDPSVGNYFFGPMFKKYFLAGILPCSTSHTGRWTQRFPRQRGSLLFQTLSKSVSIDNVVFCIESLVPVKGSGVSHEDVIDFHTQF